VSEKKKCDYCGKDINVKYFVCPLCGAHLPEKVEPLSLKCPRCKMPLNVYPVGGEEYNICPSCNGLWVDKHEFHILSRESVVYKKEDFKDTYSRGSSVDTVSYIPCVRCGSLMNRKNFAKISGVILDECGRHGVWLDAGELEKIRHFIFDGGLEKAQDIRIEMTRNELKELETKVDQTAFSHKIIHFWNFKRWLFGG
jgi:Zn-finger nucleic acid-binding protein